LNSQLLNIIRFALVFVSLWLTHPPGVGQLSVTDNYARRVAKTHGRARDRPQNNERKINMRLFKLHFLNNHKALIRSDN
jgi:hypothetical protein